MNPVQCPQCGGYSYVEARVTWAAKLVWASFLWGPVVVFVTLVVFGDLAAFLGVMVILIFLVTIHEVLLAKRQLIPMSSKEYLELTASDDAA